MPVLIRLLRNRELMAFEDHDPNNYTKAETCKKVLLALGKIGGQAKDAVPEILQASRHPSSEVREYALTALGGIGADTEEVTNRLARVPLQGEDDQDYAWRVPAAAAWALGKIGPPAKDAVPALIEAARDIHHGRYHVAQNARWALIKIGTPEALAAAKPYPAFNTGYPEDLLDQMKPALVSRPSWESPPFWARD